MRSILDYRRFLEVCSGPTIIGPHWHSSTRVLQWICPLYREIHFPEASVTVIRGCSFNPSGSNDCTSSTQKIQRGSSWKDCLCACWSYVAFVLQTVVYESNIIKVSGTGLFACQLAKNVFHAGKVITTVSTTKVEKVKELLGEGTVDESEDSNSHG